MAGSSKERQQSEDGGAAPSQPDSLGGIEARLERRRLGFELGKAGLDLGARRRLPIGARLMAAHASR